MTVLPTQAAWLCLRIKPTKVDNTGNVDPFPPLPYNLPAMTTTNANANAFAHPEHLIEPAQLSGLLDDPAAVVVDLDSEAGYLRGHVPGARRLPDDYERNPETGWVNTLPPERFAAVCQSLGIGDDTLVIAYDNNLSLYAARFWWTLNYYGHRQVRVLNGGWRQWVAAGYPVAFAPPRPVSPAADAVFTPRTDPSLLAEFDQVRAGCPVGGLAAADTVIWDTRSAGEYSGAVNRGNQRAGHITGAAHLDWLDLMERETHRFKSPTEIRQLLNDQGITPDKAVFAY